MRSYGEVVASRVISWVYPAQVKMEPVMSKAVQKVQSWVSIYALHWSLSTSTSILMKFPNLSWGGGGGSRPGENVHYAKFWIFVDKIQRPKIQSNEIHKEV